MICPCEKKGETSVVDSRPTEDGTAIRRRRLCSCGERFTTFERIQYREIMVIKKNGRKSALDRDKLAKSIYIALKKRPLDTDTVEKFITKISNFVCFLVSSLIPKLYKFLMLSPRQTRKRLLFLADHNCPLDELLFILKGFTFMYSSINIKVKLNYIL